MMSQGTDEGEMRRNMEYISTQLSEYESKLRKKEQSTISKIEEERRMMEKFTLRRDFYDKLQTNMGPGEEEAAAKLDAAEKGVAIVQQKVQDLESSKLELEASLNEVLTQNKLNVLPEIERLGNLLQTSEEEIAISSRSYAADEQRLQELKCLKESMESEERKLHQTIKERENALCALQDMPDIHAKELIRVQRDVTAIHIEINNVDQSKKDVQVEINQQNGRKSEIDEQKNGELTKLHREQTVLEERRLRVDGYGKQVAEAKIYNYSLASQTLEIELHIKKAQDEIRHNSKFLTAENRQLKLGKSCLVKKQQSTAKLKSSIPQIKSKLILLQQTVSIIEAEKQSYEKTLLALKEKVESSYSTLFDGQHIEDDILLSLEESAKAVAEREYEIEQAQVEERRANTLLSLMKERRVITQRKIQNTEQLKNDVDMAIHIQEIQKLDLNKKMKDTEKRARDFSTLHEMIRNEKVESTRLIGETKKALNDMRVKYDDLQVELRSRTAERSEKIKTLQDETDARRAAQHVRASKRTDKSKSWSNYRRSLEDMERQEAQIDKLRSLLSNSRKEVERATLQTEQLIGVKYSMTEQLNARKTQLVQLYNNANAYAEALKKGELSIRRVHEDGHIVELKNKNIQRKINILKKDLENSVDTEEKILNCQTKLEMQVLETERLSQELENPNQEGRFQALDGKDPSEEELVAKLSTLERLVRNKKEILLTKEISAKEIAIRILQLESTSNNWKAATQSLLKDTNDYQGRVQERQRLRTAQKSEIRMYDELIIASKAKKADLEQDIMLREQLVISDGVRGISARVSDQVESSTPPPPIRRQSYERPTAYLPIDDEADTIKVPRPYGALAPFAPGPLRKKSDVKAKT